MKILKKFISVIVFTILCLAITLSSASAHTFSDVTAYDDAIGLLSTLEVIKGYSETRFGPDDDVTRWQMALLISKLVTGNVDTSTWEAEDNSSSFTDVKSNHYFGSIAYAHRNGIIIGRSDEIFAPEDKITFQDGLTMVVRALGYPSSTLNAGYPDSYIEKGKELGLLKDIDGLGYTANMSRGHTAQLLYNALFAETFTGTSLAEGAFGIVERTIVLTATENMKITSNVSYAKSDTLIFSEMDEFGRLTDAYTFDASLFDFKTPNEYLGVAYKILATDDFSYVLELTQLSKFIAESKTTGLSVAVNQETITLGNEVYEPVPGYRTYKLEADKVPSGTKEIIVYGMNDVYRTQGTVIVGNYIAGTTAYYNITAFDDNNDGYIDRALYFPYSFGQYVIDSTNKVAIAGSELTSAITYTGVTARSEDYVIYSYNPQSKTLDIKKVLESKEGTISTTSYTTAQGTVKIGNDTFDIGRSEVNGVADKSTLETPLINASATINGRTIKYVADGTYIYKYELGDALPGEVTYASNVGAITNIPTYNAVYGYYTVVLNNTTTIAVAMVDGSAVSAYSTTMTKGDIVKYELHSTVSGATTYKVTRITPSPTYTTNYAASKIYTNNNYLYVMENGGVTKSYWVSSVTPIYYIDTNLDFTAYTTSSFSEKNPTTYYSVFVAYDSSYTTIIAIYLRPFDASLVSSTGEFNRIVYIPSSSINSSTVGTNSRVYSAIDLVDGTSVSVTLNYSTFGITTLSSAGYYRVYNNILTNVNPVTESSVASSNITMVTNAVLSEMTLVNASTGSYIIISNNKAFSVAGDNLKVYVYESSYNNYNITRYSLDSATVTSFINNVNSSSTIQTADIIYTNDYYDNTYYGSLTIIIK